MAHNADFPRINRSSSLTYEDAVAKGNRLLREINKLPSETTSSKWRNFADVDANGWQKHATSVRTLADSGLTSLAEEYGIGVASDKNENVDWRHPVPTKDGSIAFYRQLYNVDARTIFAYSTQSPTRLRDEDAAYRIPELSHWSDVTYLQWQDLTSRPGDLKRIVRCHIDNTGTRDILDKVMVGADGKRNPRPLSNNRRTFTSEDGDDFKALMGTPNVIGAGWLLAQHKAVDQLGWKCVESISICCPDGKELDPGRPLYNMIIEIGKHPKAVEGT